MRQKFRNQDFDYAIDEYLYYCQSRRLRQKTMQSYEQTLRLFERWAKEREGITNPDDVRPQTIRRYICELQERGKYTFYACEDQARISCPERRRDYRQPVSVTTINNYIRNLRAFFNWYADEHPPRDSPMKKIRPLKDERQKREYLEDDEVRKLLNIFDKSYFSERRDVTIILLLLDTGMRLGECLALKIDSVDLVERTIVIPAETTKGCKERCVFFSTKTAREMRRWLAFKDRYAYYGITTNAPKGKFSKVGTCSYEIDSEKITLPEGFESHIAKKIQNHSDAEEKNYEDYIRQAAANNNFKYLLSRGISEKTQRKFFIGYDENWNHPNRRNFYKDVYPAQCCIIPTSVYSYLARDTKPGSKCKMKVGKTHIFNFKLHLIREPKPLVFVTEGEIDALSVEEMGYPAIGLGSAEMAAQFCDGVNQLNEYPDFIFLPDNDKAGESALDVLRNGLPYNPFSCSYYIARINYHDPNDFLVNDRDGFRKFLKECYERPEKLEPLHID